MWRMKGCEEKELCYLETYAVSVSFTRVRANPQRRVSKAYANYDRWLDVKERKNLVQDRLTSVSDWRHVEGQVSTLVYTGLRFQPLL